MTDSQKEAYDKLATEMDARDKYMFMLRDFFLKHGFIPDASVPEFPSVDHHRESFKAFQKDRFKSWRLQPKVVKRIKRAAKKAAKAKGLEKLVEEAKDRA